MCHTKNKNSKNRINMLVSSENEWRVLTQNLRPSVAMMMMSPRRT
jgi:hypothetical protein